MEVSREPYEPEGKHDPQKNSLSFKPAFHLKIQIFLPGKGGIDLKFTPENGACFPDFFHSPHNHSPENLFLCQGRYLILVGCKVIWVTLPFMGIGRCSGLAGGASPAIGGITA